MGRAIHMSDVSFSYASGAERIAHLSLEVHPGELLVITGVSGSGKSTVTRLINGLAPRFFGGELHGSLAIEGIAEGPSSFLERTKCIGNVFQDPRSQFFSNEVAGEIAFGCENYGRPHEEIVERVRLAAEEIGIAPLLNERVRTLSYGMRQKVAIASAEAMEPEIYVMDEPSANLDVEATYQLSTIIGKLKDQGKTIVITEHRLYYLMDLADRFVHLENGRLTREFTPRELRGLPAAKLRELGLRTANLYDCEPALVKAAKPGDEMLRLAGIRKAFDSVPVLQDVSFSVGKGESVAIIGPNGVGKSTIGKIASGLIKEDGGTVSLECVALKGKRRRGRVWYIPQDLDSWLFGEDLMDELLTGGKATADKRREAEEILGRLGLRDVKDQHPATLSGGQKQRLALGVALAHHASTIILDEPTSGLDGRSMRIVSGVIRSLSESGIATLVISHDAECILSCCSRAIQIEDGRVVDDFKLKSTSKVLGAMGYSRLYPKEAGC